MSEPGWGAREAESRVANSGETEAFVELLELPSDRVPVRYFAGTLDRATRVQWRLDPSLLRFERLTRRPQAVRITVLDRERWEQLALSEPYGLPVRLEPGHFLVAGPSDTELVQRIEELLGGSVPLLEGEPLVGTREGAGALAISDLLLLFDVCQDFVLRAGLTSGDPVGSALLGHWLARLALEEEAPLRAVEVAKWLDRLALVSLNGELTPLEAYRPNLRWRERLRFEARFFRGADLLWVEEGNRGTERRFYRWFERGQRVQLKDLQKRYPRLREWARSQGLVGAGS